MGLSVYRNASALGSYEDILSDIRTAEAEGLDRYWVPSAPLSSDGLSLAAAAATMTSSINIAVGVVPVPARHPMILAQQALTVSGLSHGRLTLGVGMSVAPLVERVWGLGAERPRTRLESFLEVLIPLLSGKPVDVENEFYRVKGALGIEATDRPSLYLAVMGPGMAAAAGSLADGAITFLAGTGALETVIVPAALAAAEARDRPPPAITAAVPVCVTSDTDAARAQAEKFFGHYNRHPSGARLLGANGHESPTDFAIIGSLDEVQAKLGAITEAGADEIAAMCFGATPDDLQRTRALVGSGELLS